jgi:predicted PurR-regulated permease PerM
MTVERGARISLGLCATVLAAAGLQAGAAIIAPVVFALFTIALVWPLHARLLDWLPALLAVLMSLAVTVLVLGGLGWIVVWGFGRVGQWLVTNATRFQALYAEIAAWLEGHGLYAAGLLAERFDVSWLLRAFREISTRLHGTLSFSLVTLVFVLLGLLEVRPTARRISRVLPGNSAERLLAALRASAARLQTYMAVRTAMSVLTGLSIFAFAFAVGLDLAAAWGAIALALNYIPFIGPLVATVLPTVVALVQFGSWQMALFVLLAMNLIQFAIGSYLEPRVAGRAVALSPFIVLLAVFAWAFLWGIPGAFIGVPIVIVAVTVAAHYPGTQPIAELLKAGD